MSVDNDTAGIIRKGAPESLTKDTNNHSFKKWSLSRRTNIIPKPSPCDMIIFEILTKCFERRFWQAESLPNTRLQESSPSFTLLTNFIGAITIDNREKLITSAKSKTPFKRSKKIKSFRLLKHFFVSSNKQYNLTHYNYNPSNWFFLQILEQEDLNNHL